MSNFNLNDYEPVKERKARFYEDHKDGRIVVDLLNADSITEFALFRAKVYMTQEDQKSDCPRGVGYALEIRDKTLSTSNNGKSYETVNYSSWTENCEESAVGRALDNAGYSGNKKASREEMIKVERMSAKPEERKAFTKPDGEINRNEMGKTACVGCGRYVSPASEKYSLDKFGKVLCMTCQKKEIKQ